MAQQQQPYRYVPLSEVVVPNDSADYGTTQQTTQRPAQQTAQQTEDTASPNPPSAGSQFGSRLWKAILFIALFTLFLERGVEGVVRYKSVEDIKDLINAVGSFTILFLSVCAIPYVSGWSFKSRCKFCNMETEV
ncbi:hypothetical protein GGR57DRAFT_500925 [Xylariaceae sp. FL1272]|nr:hypothetical protein GGR57DRAFT_500925 [Xylariaceae sp. FL1272]